jgi:hypothetical protein
VPHESAVSRTSCVNIEIVEEVSGVDVVDVRLHGDARSLLESCLKVITL